MELTVVIFTVVNGVALLLLPRRWAPLPLLVGACYMTRAQAIEIGVATLTVVRILIAIGIIRIAIRREWVRGFGNSLDWLIVAWGVWMVASVLFHTNPSAGFVLRVREAYEAWGLYLLFRVFVQSKEDIRQLSKILALVMLPIAVAMASEKSSGVNFFAQFGGVDQFSAVRDGVVRAQGPFAHAILAGSIGGVCLPLILGGWRDRRVLTFVGSAACLTMVLASGSSGPILTAGAGIGVLLLWQLRGNMRLVRWSMLLIYLGLEVVMNRPAYFIITYIDLTGSSTSWHRAELIRSTIAHFGEWWLVGTDYTRHWMASGVADPNHADITNHYIGNGVVGGLLLMMLFIWLIVKGFSQVGKAMHSENDGHGSFFTWAVGASLFAHAVTCLSVSYFDHSIIFLYLTLAATTATLSLGVMPDGAAVPVPAPSPLPVRVSHWQPARTRRPASAFSQRAE
jgi:hypothetical protein